MRHPALLPNSSRLRNAFVASLIPLLAACGGGDSSSQSSDSGTTSTEAKSSSSTTLSSGQSAATSVDAAYHATAQLVATGSSTQSVQAAASGVKAVAQASSDVTAYTMTCDSGGTATVTISGGTAQTRSSGVLVAGQQYTVTFSACKTEGGLVQLDGDTSLDVKSVTTGAPSSIVVSMTLSNLKATAAGGTTTLNGTMTIERSENTSGSKTVSASSLTSSDLSLTTEWNSRSANLSLANVDVTFAVTRTGDVPSSSSLQGQYSVSGNAGGRDFSDSVSISSEIDFDSSGNPSSGLWTSADSQGTVQSSVSDGKVTVQYDKGSDGTTDFSLTATVADWRATAG